MNTVTIPKSEYTKIIKTQEKLEKNVSTLQRMFKKVVQEDILEVRPSYIRKLDKIEKDLDAGNGVRFLNAKEAKAYLRNL